MPKIRVLIVDDSTVVRRFLSDAISKDPELEVVGTASNGAIALQKIVQLNPQVVTMDIEMPEMSGLEALAMLKRSHIALPVIMVSSLTERGAAATLEALSLGAADYVTKPSSMHAPGDEEKQAFLGDLLPKLKALGAPKPAVGSVRPALPTGPRPAGRAPAAFEPPRPGVAQVARRAGRIDVVAIGVSTGGPNALAELIPALPADFPIPIVIVQHMPPIFTKLLADRLRAKAAIAVKEGASGDPVTAGVAFIAPGGHHMVVTAGDTVHIATNLEAPENSCRPAVDVLFRSVSDVYGPAVLAVVMTGMGQDGLRGCELVRERGGQVLVQDEKTSVVWGMPGFVADAGLADEVLPLEQLAAAIVRRARVGRVAAQSAAGRR